MIETLACVCSSESTQRELSNEYQNGRVWMVFKNDWVLVLWTKVAPALEGLNGASLMSYFSKMVSSSVTNRMAFELMVKMNS